MLANRILALSRSKQSRSRLENSRLEVIAFGLREMRSPIPRLAYGELSYLGPQYFVKAERPLSGVFTNVGAEVVMASVAFEVLKLNGLAVDLLEEVVEDVRWDEVSLAGW